MSIYISIPTLIDPEIENTISTAINNSENNVFVGVACMTPTNFCEHLKEKFRNNSNVQIKWFDPQQNFGVGKGRNNAKSMYDNQEYFLQIDSHTHFDYAWDTQLISWLKEAQSQTDKKVVITGYPSFYRRDINGLIDVFDRLPKYPIWTNNLITDNIKISGWEIQPLNFWPYPIRPKWKMFPATKISAAFVFGDRNFANHNGLSEEIIFWEEEIINSIALYRDGFALVFVNEELPLSHLYTGNQDSKNIRQNVSDLPSFYVGTHYQLMQNYYDFINKNKEACREFERYSGYSVDGGICRPFHVPAAY